MAPRKKLKSPSFTNTSKVTPSTSRKLVGSSKTLPTDSVCTVRYLTRQRLSTASLEEQKQFTGMLEQSRIDTKKKINREYPMNLYKDQGKLLDTYARMIALVYDAMEDVDFTTVENRTLLKIISSELNLDQTIKRSAIRSHLSALWDAKPSLLKQKVKNLLELKIAEENENSYGSDISSSDDSSDEDETWKPSKVTSSRKPRKLSSSSKSSGDDQQDDDTESKRKELDKQCAEDPTEVAVDDSSMQSTDPESEFTQQQQQKINDPAKSFSSPHSPIFSASAFTQLQPTQMQDQIQARNENSQVFDDITNMSSTNSNDEMVDYQLALSSSGSSTANSSMDINASQADSDFASSINLLPDLQDRTSLLQQLKELYYMSTEPHVQDKVFNIQALLEAQHQYKRTALQLRLEELYRMPTSPHVQHAIADIQEKLQTPKRCNAENQSTLQVPVSTGLSFDAVSQVQIETASGFASERHKQLEKLGVATGTSEMDVEERQLYADSKEHKNSQKTNSENIQIPEVLDVSSSDEECSVVFQFASKQLTETANGNSLTKKRRIH